MANATLGRGSYRALALLMEEQSYCVRHRGSADAVNGSVLLFLDLYIIIEEVVNFRAYLLYRTLNAAIHQYTRCVCLLVRLQSSVPCQATLTEILWNLHGMSRVLVCLFHCKEIKIFSTLKGRFFY